MFSIRSGGQQTIAQIKSSPMLVDLCILFIIGLFKFQVKQSNSCYNDEITHSRAFP